MANQVKVTPSEQKTQEALQVLGELGFPRQQLNERSALTLLALLDLKPDDSWADARAPLMGIMPWTKYHGKLKCGLRNHQRT
ncbi:MAG: hypothetical protein V2A77_05505 [Pseudomonadota bacterium]